MNMGDMAKTIALVTPYYDNPNSVFFSAEHDEIFLPNTDKALPPEAVAEMRELGWHQEDVPEDEYDPDEGWIGYT